MARRVREIGLSCWHNPCRNQFSFVVPKGMRAYRASEEMHEAAGKAGWVLGLDPGGQAHYGCPDHGDALIDPTPCFSLLRS